MKINQIQIKNIYSFENVSINFDSYNLIVGANNSGKTNLIRILNIFKRGNNILWTELNKEQRFSLDQPSSLYFKLTLTNEELQLILESLFNKDLQNVNFAKPIHNFEIFISWSGVVLDVSTPTYIVFRFSNGLTIFSIGGDHHLTVTDYIPSEHPDKFLSKIKNFNNIADDPKYVRKHGLLPNHILESESFQKEFFSGSNVDIFFNVSNFLGYITISPVLKYIRNHEQEFIIRNIKFIGDNPNPGATSSFFSVLTAILKNQMTFVNELIPQYNDLTTKLVKLKLKDEKSYDILKKDFEKIFDGVSFIIKEQQKDNQTNNKIIMLEKDKEFPIESSASGHLSALNLFYSILNRKNSTIFLDEPEIHFHPTKISLIGKILKDMSQNSTNQICIITHSPNFLNSLLAHYKQHNVIYFKKISKQTEIISPTSDFKSTLAPHLFNPDIFFEKCVILVEGPGDAFVLQAISDHFNSIFNHHNIAIVSTGGVGGIDPYTKILSTYEIPYVGLADMQYTSEDSNIFVLKANLEEELENLGWKRNDGEHLCAVKAYPIMEEILSNPDNKKNLFNSPLWRVIDNSLKKIGVKFDKETSVF